jgi:ABC-2 type transport system ATP-binding protein
MLSDFGGDVEVLGKNIKTEGNQVKQQIGYVAENAALYEMLTPNEYLLFIGRLYHLSDAVIQKRVGELLEIFGLKDKADARMNSFSKGMKQKVLLISGMIHNPDIIFLDEPLSGLDANAVILFKEILQKLKAAGKTIFYSSHIMDVVEKISDRIIIIDKGQIVADGTFADLKAQASGSASLEGIFAGLTGSNQETETKADDFIHALG